MQVRVLDVDDAIAYWKLRLEALQAEPRAFGKAAEEFEETTTIADIETRIRELPRHSFFAGAFAGDRLVGIATFFRQTRVKERHKANVFGVYVTPEFRGRSFGRALLEAILERAKSDPDVEQIGLAVATGQAAAISLYRSLGFELYGTEPRALKNGTEYVDEHLMVLKLR